MPTRTKGPEGGGCDVLHWLGVNKILFIRVRKLESESPKRTISTSGESGSLQIVSAPDTGQCASLFVVPRKGVDTRGCASKDAGPKGVNLMVVPRRLEKGMSANEDVGFRRGWL